MCPSAICMTNSTSANAVHLRSGNSCRLHNSNWKKPPTYLLLNGRASLDPRNYLGFGNLDLVPTSIVPSTSLMTASDDWFSDFTNNGMPTIATGRLPVSTLPTKRPLSLGKSLHTMRHPQTVPWTAQCADGRRCKRH